MSIRVLVVDDTDHVRHMLGDMLELDGFQVVGKASSGLEAVALAGEVAPDVIVMDLKMPDIDGVEAARRIRTTRPAQVVILYTAYLDARTERAAREAGIAMCVGKVEGLNQLERHIAEVARTLQTR